MQEGLSYITGAELPRPVVNVVGGGFGAHSAITSRLFSNYKGGGHGDYRLITLIRFRTRNVRL